MSLEKKPLGRILLEQRAVSPEQLDKALADKSGAGRLASRLTEQGVLRDVEALKALSEQFGVPGIDFGADLLAARGARLIAAGNRRATSHSSGFGSRRPAVRSDGESS
ncbi:MAG: hypothetical protein QM784_11960 [Polyangiaceae bacterium]